ncbi:hypothetical protein PH505_ag00890 [Pseudoalteromonas distincta]|nr:hypothetical protein PH505_ag00890 [Pseudoalteromonas distincta]
MCKMQYEASQTHNKASQNRGALHHWTRASARLCLRRYILSGI